MSGAADGGARLAARFRALHAGRTGGPLVLPGPWDAATARIFAEAGAEALATPSHGVSLSLGYEDGTCPADEMFAAVARIARAVDVPVSADAERGYGLPPDALVERLLTAGAVGCNLEDTEHGALVDPSRQADFLAAVRQAAGGRLFLNARIDSYLRQVPDPLADALERGLRYAEAGADCLYPIGAPLAGLRVLAERLPLPVNALCRAGSAPGPAELGRAGAARVTFGGSLAALSRAHTAELARNMYATPS